ncbi:PREDICTED: LOW QUALITY PROTEIN: acid-sensing ion channel 4 [Bison bison bison]|uniref:LOW QUALITY PROTEIN: acid-sensing ion channel 4 n=1 Tax=Bison bison bison TaxID=43346 RepID=A0A6P3J6P6_BISBB|nr:PREDICTED: LOW QUALITY PROTEIN: acid-sensing ion channel 4 [Bison bison bison]
MLSGAAGAARRGRAVLAPSLTRSLAGTHAGADSCAGADKGSHKETIEERDKRQQRQQRQRHHQGCGAAGSGSDSPTSGPHPVPILFPLALSLEEPLLPPPPLQRAPGAAGQGGRGRKAPAGPSIWGQMPIEIVCKIKFAEEDAKPKEKEAGDEQSLLGAAQGAAAPRDLATFASTSTLHGLGRACGPGPHGLRRTLWALALLTSLAAFLYQAAGLARGYLTRPHLVVMDPAAPAPAAGFPAVTLCNINRFRHSALSDADIFHLANLTGLPPKDRDGHRAAGLRYPEPDMVDILNRTGHQLADMLKSCNFSGHHCSASNFSVVYTRYGKCYTFNADPQSSLPSRAGGMGSGLEIMLDIQQEEYLPIWRETNETSFEAGIRVQIHSQEEPPYIHQLGFGVSPGFQTFVSCQEQRLTYLPQPWGNCRAESGLREPELQGYSAYSVSACRLRCEKEAVLQRCHCRMVHMPDSLGGGSGGPCFCPTPCNLTRYGKEISMVRIPNRGSARYLARKYNRNETYIRENFLVLDVFFEALTSEAMEQRAAYGLSALLGDLGGQMGLFIGASILTLLEILDYIYEVSWDRLKRAWRRPKTPLRTSTGGISTLGLQELKEQSPCPSRGRAEGGGASSLLPNHHHPHGPPGSLFEDFAC